MNVLALDLGEKCGWAMNRPKPMNGVWHLKPTKFESTGIRFLKFKRHLEIELTIGGVEKVFFEAVRAHMAVDAAHAYGGYLAVLQAVCIEYEVPYEGISVQAIKKHATGSGNAKKDQMIVTAIKKFKGINIIDDNHADALWLLDYVENNS